MTLDLGLHRLTRRTAPLIRLLRQARGDEELFNTDTHRSSKCTNITYCSLSLWRPELVVVWNIGYVNFFFILAHVKFIVFSAYSVRIQVIVKACVFIFTTPVVRNELHSTMGDSQKFFVWWLICSSPEFAVDAHALSLRACCARWYSRIWP